MPHRAGACTVSNDNEKNPKYYNLLDMKRVCTRNAPVSLSTPIIVNTSHRIGVDHQRDVAFDSVPVEIKAEARPVGSTDAAIGFNADRVGTGIFVVLDRHRVLKIAATGDTQHDMQIGGLTQRIAVALQLGLEARSRL